MSFKFLILILVLPVSAFGKEICSLEELDMNAETYVVERLYYTGTCHYRNKNYNLSAESWRELAHMENVKPEFKELQVNSLNNLGFLLFLGYGVNKNQASAVEYWAKAVSLGHQESEYHLCHAYAGKDDKTYNPQLAKVHCNKAEAIYRSIEEKDDEDKEILRQIKSYQESL